MGQQSVEHVLLRCALAEEARMKAGREMEEEVSVRSLLHTEKGVEWGEKIWDEFENERGSIKRRQREQEGIEEKEEDLWDMGALD